MTTNGSKIQTVKSDHITVGGYSHSILRPPDTVHVPRDIRYSNGVVKQCDWPLFSPKGHQQWCNEDVAIGYYAMRPIVSPDTYQEWLVTLFRALETPNPEIDTLLSGELSPNMFCGSQEDVMRWLMGRIDQIVHQLPQFQKNGSWKYEQFYNTDVQFYSFATQESDRPIAIYKIVFNLYNTLRSISTLVTCTIVNNGENLYVHQMGFVSDTNKHTPYEGFNIGTPKYGVGVDSGLRDIGFGWDYGNTLESQKFNEVGFFDPLRNVTIEGGIPDSLRSKIRDATKVPGILPIPQTIGLTGVSVDNKIVTNTGQPQWVRADMGVTYSGSGPKIVYY